MRTFLKATIAASVGVIAFSAPKPALAYDMDCKVILCLAGGFPSGCGDAKSYMMKRLRKGRSPFGVCTSEGPSGSSEYSVPVRMFTRTYPKKCLKRVYVREGHGDSSWQCREWFNGRVDGIVKISIPAYEGPDYSNEFVWYSRSLPPERSRSNE